MSPRFLALQLATLVDEVPGDDWVHEVKYDGYRIEAITTPGVARLLTRNAKDWTARFASIADALIDAKIGSAILDGEVVAFDEKGRTSFRRLQQWRGNEGGSSLVYVVFDLLSYRGVDLRTKTFDERRARLATLLRALPAKARRSIVATDTIEGSGAAVLTVACRRGLEGVISKRRNAPYASGRNRSWLKIKCGRRQELIVIGFTPPRGGRVAIGSLLLGLRRGARLVYAGRVGTGMPNALLRELLGRLSRIARKSTPLAEHPRRLPVGVRWVEPRIVVEVAFTEWTNDGLLRHPSLVAVRDDKPARQVRREKAR